MLPLEGLARPTSSWLFACVGRLTSFDERSHIFTVQPAATTLELCSNMLNLPRNMTSSALQLDKCNIETSTAAWRDFQGP